MQILGTGVNGAMVVPEMIVVAIPNTNRIRDLSPSTSAVDHNGKPTLSMAGGGGGENFLRFIKSELIPRMDSIYRTTPYRMLVGHSLGGLMSISALYTMPETFNAYVAIDPSLWWDNRLLLNQAKRNVSERRYEGRSLYVAQANTLGPDDSLPNGHFASIVQFNRILETYNTSGLRYGFMYYPDDSHGSVALIAEYDALRFSFPGFGLDLQRAVENPAHIVAHYARISKVMGYTVEPPEFVMDLLGTVAASQDSTKVLPLAWLYAERYPASARAFETLGDILARQQDSVGAKAAYDRAIKLRPTSARAQAGLKRLGGTK